MQILQHKLTYWITKKQISKASSPDPKVFGRYFRSSGPRKARTPENPDGISLLVTGFQIEMF